MAFDVLPGLSGPLPIAGQQTSQLFDIKLPPGEKTFFLRFIALFRDNEPLGGEVTFQIRAGTGLITSVGPNSSADIPDGDGNVVGSVTCERFPKDVFLLTISEIAENSGPWKIRIRNNDPESLRFLGFTSTQAENTFQPWLVVGDPNSQPFFLVGVHERLDVEVRNLGTKPLIFFEDIGPIAEDSRVTLAERPDQIDLHGAGKLTFVCDAFRLGTTRHSLRCNDTFSEHKEISFLGRD